MRIYLRFICLLMAITILHTSSLAQSAAILDIAKACSQVNLQKDLYHLASDEMEGRLMASRGDTLASLFIAGKFTEAGLIAPYAGSYFQPLKQAGE
jgi:hypothetical protein